MEECAYIRDFPLVYFIFRHSGVIFMSVGHRDKNFFGDISIPLRCLFEELQGVVVQVVTNNNAANAVDKRIQKLICQLTLGQDQVPDFLQVGSGGLRDPHAQLRSNGVDYSRGGTIKILHLVHSLSLKNWAKGSPALLSLFWPGPEKNLSLYRLLASSSSFFSLFRSLSAVANDSVRVLSDSYKRLISSITSSEDGFSA